MAPPLNSTSLSSFRAYALQQTFEVPADRRGDQLEAADAIGRFLQSLLPIEPRTERWRTFTGNAEPSTAPVMPQRNAPRGLLPRDLAPTAALTPQPAALTTPPTPARTPTGRRADAYVNGRRTAIQVAPVGNGQVMRTDAAAAFNRMRRDAARQGITLSARSAFRTYREQAELRRRFLNGTGNPADPPGYSNHQGGISIDIRNTKTYRSANYRWLRAHAHEYGFVNNARKEPWHWSYRPR